MLTSSVTPKSTISRPSMNVMPAATASGAGAPYGEYGERVVGSGSGACPEGSGRESVTVPTLFLPYSSGAL